MSDYENDDVQKSDEKVAPPPGKGDSSEFDE